MRVHHCIYSTMFTVKNFKLKRKGVYRDMLMFKGFMFMFKGLMFIFKGLTAMF